ncbi:hypothetical protein MEA186_28607 [Mesorhizobium amorphae CCNWGS0123]|uniref:Uncharacterized protein n=1 Tax=Mesorhizobium amorphae CCNWGS0123 TaxID=1082933 RepID=G6YIA1_9HYPH|nr:hypothetical protein A6B35_30665 [Mesorhizobium amorphae CCNWGS0123]EHH06282.1 hypothetical protein MEA186_28607 [Mesorhizobium amorphae CCNWGS0123]
MIERAKVPSKREADLIVPDDAEKAAFVRGLIERGEAVEANPDGSLPPGATHLIVGKTENGLPIVKRARFSAF